MYIQWWTLWRRLPLILAVAAILAGGAYVARGQLQRDSSPDTIAASETVEEVDGVVTTLTPIAADDPAWERESLYLSAINTLREQQPANLESFDGFPATNRDRVRVLVLGGEAMYPSYTTSIDERFGPRLEHHLDAALGLGGSDVHVLSAPGAVFEDYLTWAAAIESGDRSVLPISAQRLEQLQQPFDAVVVAVETGSQVSSSTTTSPLQALRGEHRYVLNINGTTQSAQLDALVTAGYRDITATVPSVTAGLQPATIVEQQQTTAYAIAIAEALLADLSVERISAATDGADGRTGPLVASYYPLSVTLSKEGDRHYINYVGGGDGTALCNSGVVSGRDALVSASGTFSVNCGGGSWVIESSTRETVGAQDIPCVIGRRPHAAVWLRRGITGSVELRNDGDETISVAVLGVDAAGVSQVGPWATLGASKQAAVALGDSAAGTVSGFAIAGSATGCAIDEDVVLDPFTVSFVVADE